MKMRKKKEESTACDDASILKSENNSEKKTITITWNEFHLILIWCWFFCVCVVMVSVIQTWHSLGDSVQIALPHMKCLFPTALKFNIRWLMIFLAEINHSDLICDYFLHSTISFRVFGSTKSFYFLFIIIIFFFNLASFFFPRCRWWK